MKIIIPNISKRILEERTARGWERPDCYTLRNWPHGEVTDDMKIVPNLWTKWEVQNPDISLSNLIKIAMLFNISLDQLVFGKCGAPWAASTSERLKITGTTGGSDYDATLALPSPHPSAYALLVDTNDLGEAAKQGDALMVAPHLDLMPGELVVIKPKDKDRYITNLVAIRGGSVYCSDPVDPQKRSVLAMDALEYAHPVIARVSPSGINL
ncbi:hypothetical protein [Rheinheimera sp.]|uniref:helix-turn-helix domain-containing protein n=1 Tax=Rheinheimera sp. TaxID=1869214 RepID=UPI00307DA11F